MRKTASLDFRCLAFTVLTTSSPDKRDTILVMEKNFCANCGAALSPGHKYCSSCGRPVDTSAAPAHPQAAAHSQPQPAASPHNPGLSHANPAQTAEARAALERIKHPTAKRHSEIITTDDTNGEQVVKVRSLHPNAVWLFFLQYLGKSSIILLLFVVAAVVEPVLSVLFVMVYFLAVYGVSRLTFKNYEFEISPIAFKKVHGILHKYTVNIAFNQIQNINIRRSMIDQILGLAHLEIETSGTGGVVEKNVGGLPTVSEGYIPGITPQEADDIMQLMLSRVEN